MDRSALGRIHKSKTSPQQSPAPSPRVGPRSAMQERVVPTLSSHASQRSLEKKAGIDLDVLKRTFRHIDDGDGSLQLKEFRELYKQVFPQMEWSEAAFKETEEMFMAIDSDNSGEVCWREILAYLEQSHQIFEQGRPPADLKGVVFRFVGGQKVPFYDDEGSTTARAARAYRVVSALVSFFSYILVVWDSEPAYSHDNAGEVTYKSDTLIFALETECMLLFVVETILYVWSCPTRSVIRQPDGSTRRVCPNDVVDPAQAVDDTRAIVGKESLPAMLVRDPYVWINLAILIPYIITAVNRGVAGGLPDAVMRFVVLMKCIRVVRFLWLTTKEATLAAALWEERADLMYMLILICIVVGLGACWGFLFEIDQATFDEAEGVWIRNADSQYNDAGNPIMMQSVPEACWWVLVTLTTVGYGDVYPVTYGGKVVTIFVMMAGLLILTYSMYTLTSTFARRAQESAEMRSRNARAREFYLGMQSWIADNTAPNRKRSASAARSINRASSILSGVQCPLTPRSPLSPCDDVTMKDAMTVFETHGARMIAVITALEAKIAALEHVILHGHGAPIATPHLCTPTLERTVTSDTTSAWARPTSLCRVDTNDTTAGNGGVDLPLFTPVDYSHDMNTQFSTFASEGRVVGDAGAAYVHAAADGGGGGASAVPPAAVRRRSSGGRPPVQPPVMATAQQPPRDASASGERGGGGGGGLRRGGSVRRHVDPLASVGLRSSQLQRGGNGGAERTRHGGSGDAAVPGPPLSLAAPRRLSVDPAYDTYSWQEPDTAAAEQHGDAH